MNLPKHDAQIAFGTCSQCAYAGQLFGAGYCAICTMAHKDTQIKALQQVNAELERRALRSEKAPWIEEELADGDKICEAAGVRRTEGGRLPVAKIINAIQGRPVKPHRSGGSQAPEPDGPSFSSLAFPSAVGAMPERLKELRQQWRASPSSLGAAVAYINGLEYEFQSAIAATWQPIETAPKDGTDILLVEHGVHGYGEIDVGSWGFIEKSDADGSDVIGWLSNYGRVMEPSHWLPLPTMVLPDSSSPLQRK